MSIFDEITKMKKEGLDDSQISRRLRKEGASPKEIDDALSQSQVNPAASTYQDISNNTEAPYPDFQPEIANHPESENFEQPAIAAPYLQDSSEQYSQYPEYQYQSEPIDTEIISEITEQILEEKTREMQKDISELIRFKIEIQGKVDNVENRLRRIELTIDKLQTSIIGSMGSYGKNISDLKKEMQSTQESFSKIVNPLAENLEELRKITKGLDTETKHRKRAKD